MKRIFRRSGIFTAILFISILPVFAQSSLDHIEAQQALVTEFEVNGLKVLVKRRPTAPTISAGLFIRGGAANVNDKNAGIESLMLNTAVEAGMKFPRQQVRRTVAATGSSISAGSNQDFSVISLASTKENFNRIWDIFADVVNNPAFAKEDIERVRQQMIAGLRESETSPDGALNALQDRVLYKDHPYGNDVNGTIPNLTRFTDKDLRDYHRSLIQTSKMLLIVVGDIDAAEMKNKANAAFGKTPRGAYKPAQMPALDFSKPSLDITTRSMQTNYIQGAFNAPSLGNPDYYAMRVTMTILHQLVYEEVRLRRQLSYAPSAELNNFASNTGKIYVTAVDANQAVRVMMEQMDKLKTDLINDEFIDGMAGQFLTNYYTRQETNAAQVLELARYELFGGGWKNSFNFLKRIREVRPKNIQDVARKYMTNIRFAVIGDPNAIDRNLFLRTPKTDVE